MVDKVGDMGHRGTMLSVTSRERLDAVGIDRVATTLQALATPSRLRILARLVEGPCSASELADDAEIERSACSHQLRLLKNLGLVAADRDGRSMIYRLYDGHVTQLLDEAIGHVEHLKLGVPQGVGD
jgi:DNA-binding transcriptional ArsR family regulator